MSNPDSFVGRLREAARIKGLKQQDIADLLGKNLDRVKSIFSGKVKKLEVSEVLALEEKIHLRPDWLLRGDGPMFKSEPEQKAWDALRKSVGAVADLQVPDWVKRMAQEWAYALETGNGQRLVELATMTATHRVAEPTPAYGSKPAIDGELLQQVTAAALTEVGKQKKPLSPDKVGELLVVLYETAQGESKVNPATVKRMVKLAS